MVVSMPVIEIHPSMFLTAPERKTGLIMTRHCINVIQSENTTGFLLISGLVLISVQCSKKERPQRHGGQSQSCEFLAGH